MLTQHEKRKTLVFMLYLSGFYDKEETDAQIDLYLSEELMVSRDNANGYEVGAGDESNEEIAALKERFNKVTEKLGVIDTLNPP